MVDLPCARILRLALLLLVAAGSSRAGATTVVAKSFADLCAEADTIFAGTVESVRSQKVEGANGAIETLVRFVDLEILAGRPRGEITLGFGGGEVDGVREEVVGVPRFTAGERVLLFVSDTPAVSPVVGFFQGSFRVLRGKDGEVVVPGPGAALPGTGGGGEGAAAGGRGERRREMPFDEFRARVAAERELRGSAGYRGR